MPSTMYMPEEGPVHLEPYPGARTRGEYFRSRYFSHLLGDPAAAEPESTADVLMRYVLETHPDDLDLPPAVCHRLQEAQRVMIENRLGTAALEASMLRRFQTVESQLEDGYIATTTPTLISTDPSRPHPILADGKLTQKVILPDSVQHKSLAWNRWMQDKVRDGEMEAVFSNHPAWVGVKLAEGTWLPVGNLMVEVAEGLARIRTPAHRKHDVESRWGFDTAEFGQGFDHWFAMTHIIDKELLELSESIEPGMVDSMHLTPEVYAQSYVPIIELMELNPQLDIKGVLSDGTWAYSKVLARLFPDQAIAGLHDVAGDVIDIGNADELGMQAQISFATHDRQRREAYEKGEYQVPIASRFISKAGMEAIIGQYVHIS